MIYEDSQSAERSRQEARSPTLADSPLLRKYAAFAHLSKAELSSLDQLPRHQRTYTAGTDLLQEGQSSPSAFILTQGWVTSYRVLRGGGRQIVDFRISGDFLGLRNVLFGKADHSIEAITSINVAEFGARELLCAFERSPRLAASVLWAASRDEAIVVERLVSLGRRDAMERVAHFVLELGARLRLVGLATHAGFVCPLSQYHLADALGLSPVHINRVLRQMREEGLLTFRNGRVTFDDFDRLVQIASFDMAYLDHAGPLSPALVV